MTELLHKALTASILRAYYDVYNGTSRIYPERFYDRAMMHDLNAMSVVCTLQPEWQVLYKEKPEFERLYFAPREPRVAKSQIERAAAGLTPSKLIDPRLVYEIVGGLFDVHATLEPGFIHRIYANACYHELKLRGLPAKPQKAIQVFYRGTILGELKFGHLRVGGEVLVFPAAIQNPADLHPEMLCDWLRDQQVPLGIVANFHDTALTPTFLKPRSA